MASLDPDEDAPVPTPALPQSIAAELELTGSGDRYEREVGSFWAMADSEGERAFGGYSAALPLAAAARAAAHPALLSCFVMFLGATRPGPIEVRVTTLRSGHATSALRATSYQDGRPCVATTAWFATLDALEPTSAPEPGPELPEPDACAPSPDWSPDYPFMALFEERRIDYPESFERFSGGPPHIELWMRTVVPLGSDEPVFAQLRDIMMLDAHLLDAVVRSRPSFDVAMWSLDLAVWWSSVERESQPWIRMWSDAAAPGRGFSAVTGGLCRRDGARLAGASQQGRIY